MKSSMSYAHGCSEKPLLGITVGDFFDLTANKFPDREALVVSHQKLRFTYRKLQTECDLLARGLMSLGLKKGDRIGIWSPNYAEWVILQFAAAKIGAVLVNINPAYRSQELEYVLNQSGCSFLVLSPPFKATHYLEILQQICPELANRQPGNLEARRVTKLKTIIVFGPQTSPGAFHFEEVTAKSQDVSEMELKERQASLDFDDAINIQYTSGTTGSPKGATLTHHNIVNNAIFNADRMRFTERDRYCIPLPFYHCAGMVMGNLTCVATGATIVIPGEVFDAARTLEAVQSESCTALGGVPTMFISALSLPDFHKFDLSSLRTGFIGGSPCPLELVKQITTRLNMKEVTICYGMTETSPLSFQSCMSDPEEKRLKTVGRVHPHVECKVVDQVSGQVVPRGTPGELLIRGYSVMAGYWENREATERAIDNSGWMHTGDLATMDDEQYVNIVGRCKDMVIRGGENVYPREIEDLLHKHPKIQDVQVVGVPSEKYGEELMAWLVTQSKETVTEEELKKYCQERLTHFKIPRYWRFIDQYPMTVSGKVQKFKLREMAIRELKLEKVASITTA